MLGAKQLLREDYGVEIWKRANRIVKQERHAWHNGRMGAPRSTDIFTDIREQI